MCGITGIIDQHLFADKARGLSVLKAMSNALAHRGPDAFGVWIEEHEGIGFAHQRLSIVDLSEAGHQPMVSQNHRYVLVYNGEIYNHLQLKAHLQEHHIALKGHSDTEVLLELIGLWGVSSTIRMLNGMYAFALWDKETSQLFLVRDPIGEKPLYYGQQGDLFFFASELNAFYAHPNIELTISSTAVQAYFQYLCVPAPLSIFENIYKLPQGHMLTFNKKKNQFSIEPFFSLEAFYKKNQPLKQPQHEPIDALESILNDAVQKRLQADVPVGCFLSGGIDSSLITALSQKHTTEALHTFSVGFDNRYVNEAPYAKQIATYLGTTHHEIFLKDTDVESLFLRLPTIFSEPFADASAIPTCLVSKIAREHVKVVLSGDGADELFVGYNRYIWGAKLYGAITHLPSWSKPYAAKACNLASRFLKNTNHKTKLEKAARLLNTHQLREMYMHFLNPWGNHFPLQETSSHPLPCLLKAPLSRHPVEQMQLWDLLLVLPDDLLVKVDRASMAHHLEVRCPFLDLNVIAHAFEMAYSQKVHNTSGKWILKKLLERYLPTELFMRPKQGFSVPLQQWLQGPLQDCLNTYLSNESLEALGLFDLKIVSELQKKFSHGSSLAASSLWIILNYVLWHEDHMVRVNNRKTMAASCLKI